MAVKIRYIQEKFTETEEIYNFCWNVLCELKTVVKIDIDDNLVYRIVIFQEKLAFAIFVLQKVRNDIVEEEKYRILNKVNYKPIWFNSRMKHLSTLKKGIDNVIGIGKALGDAYAYFFYQKELELYTDHILHQRVNNNSVDIGLIGEMEFVRSVKHVKGHLTLYHGITNNLRYGDFSFIDLTNLHINWIGELKTSRKDDNTITCKLIIIKRNDTIPLTPIESIPIGKKYRRERQLHKINHFLNTQPNPEDLQGKLFSANYVSELEKLILKTKISSANYLQVSEGLILSTLKLKKTTLYRRMFYSNFAALKKTSESINVLIKKICVPDSKENSIIIGQLLYNPDFTDKSTPGTTPLFWYKIRPSILKKIYFGDYMVFTYLNPIHLISNVEKLGYHVQSKYRNNEKTVELKGIENFDFFFSHIVNFLISEKYVIEALEEMEKMKIQQPAKISIKTLQYFPCR